MNCKVILLTLIFIFSLAGAFHAQVAINPTGEEPDASAMLDVQSTDKGVLIPRMTTQDRINISGSATGLLVFDTDTDSFWYFDGNIWKDLNVATHINEEGLILDTCIIHQKSAIDNLFSGSGLVDSQLWQSFTATETGNMTGAIVSEFGGISSRVLQGYFRIYEGQGTSGTLLFERSIPNGIGNAPIWFIDEPVSLKRDSLYTLAIVDTLDGVAWGFADTDIYPNGISSIDPTYDFSFQVYMDSCELISLPILTVNQYNNISINRLEQITFADGTTQSTAVVDTKLTEGEVDAFVSNNGYLTTEVDGSPTNEIQTLEKSGNVVTLSSGGGSFTDEVSDADADPANEIQTLSLSGMDLSISGGNTVGIPSNADDLGNHTANQNIQLNGYQLSGDGDNEGIRIDNDGKVAVNTDGSSAHASAMLDVQSTDKGLLIPRMDSTGRIAIANPADGLMVYDSSSTTFWYYDEGQWNEIRNGTNKLTATELLNFVPESDFSCLTMEGKLILGGFPNNIAASGNHTYVTDNLSEDIKVIDVSNPDSPSLSGNLGIGSNPAGIAISGNYAYVIDQDSDDLKVIDVSNPASPSTSGSMALGDKPVSIAISGNHAYVVDQDSDDLKVIDVSNPASPSISGSLGVGGNPTGIAVSGNYAYVIDNSANDLKVINVSSPASPNLSGNLGIGGAPNSIAVSGNFVYVVSVNSQELKVIDVSNPASPSLSGSLGLGNFPFHLTVSGNYAYVLDNLDDDLKVIDVSNPASPSLKTRLVLGGSPRSVVVALNYAYVVSVASQDLKIIKLDYCSELLAINPSTNTFEVHDGVDGFNIGDIAIGSESIAQKESNQVDNGYVATPWVYANAIEAQEDRGTMSTLITLGDEGNYGASDEIHMITSGTSRLTANAAGNIGIGTVSPSSKLHLVGSLTIDNGTQQAGHVLTSDANGVASWEVIPNWSFIADSDDDTKIQVEESADEDQIRFDVAGSEAMRIDNSGNIGIGTNLTDAKLAIDVGADTFGIMVRSAAVDSTAGMYFSYGTNPVPVVGIQSDGDYGNSGNGGMQLMAANNRPIQFYVKKNASGTSLYNTEEAMRINGDGKVGIGRTATTNLLEVEGNASKSSAGDWIANSDARLKTNIQQLDSEQILQKLLSLQGVTYEWADDQTGTARPEGIQYGFTAQNIQEAFPELVEEDAQGFLQTAYGTYDAMYVEAIRALQQQITELKAENEQLKAEQTQVKALAQEVALIKSMLQSTASPNQ